MSAEATIATADTPAASEFLADLWRVCIKHGLMIDEFGTVIQMGGHDFALGGYEIDDEGSLLPGKHVVSAVSGARNISKVHPTENQQRPSMLRGCDVCASPHQTLPLTSNKQGLSQ